MFLIADDNIRVIDTKARVVGFVKDGKFSQEYRYWQGDSDHAEPPYLNGLSPLEMEYVAEAIQRNEMRIKYGDKA